MRKYIILVAIVLFLIVGGGEALAGQGYANWDYEQKQFYWGCIKDNCVDFIKNAQYTEWRSCALGCYAQADNYVPPPVEELFCEDSDNGIDFKTFGTVTDDKYTEGKDDYCVTYYEGTPQEKTYVFEGVCVDSKYRRYQKKCSEYGASWDCVEGACVNLVCETQEIENGVVGNYPDCEFICNEGYYLEGDVCVTDNHAPVLDLIGNQEVDVGEELIIELSATDEDGDELSYFVGTLPEGSEMNGNVFTWTPTEVGDYEITFFVSDGVGSDSEVVVVSVLEPIEFCGIVSEDTVLTKENSPYVVKCNILVEEGITLTIAPGVKLKFDGHYYIKVEGTLVADGTEEDKIVFTSNKADPQPGDWGHIKFTDTSTDWNGFEGSILDYCEVNFGGAGLTSNKAMIFIEYSSPEISNCIIKSSVDNAIILGHVSGADKFSSIQLENNVIQDNQGFGIWILSPNNVITNNVFENNGVGIYTYSGNSGNLEIIENTIKNNGHGLVFGSGTSGTLSNNEISYNSVSGIWGTPSALTIKNNDIFNNKDGIVSRYDSSPNIFNNNIYDNEFYSITLLGIDGGMSGGINPSDMSIPNNYWGTTNTDLIDEQIYDFYDDFELGKVFYEPIATEPFDIE